MHQFEYISPHFIYPAVFQSGADNLKKEYSVALSLCSGWTTEFYFCSVLLLSFLSFITLVFHWVFWQNLINQKSIWLSHCFPQQKGAVNHSTVDMDENSQSILNIIKDTSNAAPNAGMEVMGFLCNWWIQFSCINLKGWCFWKLMNMTRCQAYIFGVFCWSLASSAQGI